MCTYVHSLPQDSTSSTLSSTSTSSIVARLPSLDSSPPHMSQSPLREEDAVFAIQNMLCRVSCGKEMQDMEWKGALGILLTKPFPSNMYPPPSARNQSQTAQAQNILKLIFLAKTSLKFVLEFAQNSTHQIFSISLVHYINVRLLRKVEEFASIRNSMIGWISIILSWTTLTKLIKEKEKLLIHIGIKNGFSQLIHFSWFV